MWGYQTTDCWLANYELYKNQWLCYAFYAGSFHSFSTTCKWVSIFEYVCAHQCACICMCVCVHTCMCVCIHAFVCTWIYVCVCLDICVCTPMCMHVHVCVHPCICVYMDNWIYVCVCLDICDVCKIMNEAQYIISMHGIWIATLMTIDYKLWLWT